MKTIYIILIFIPSILLGQDSSISLFSDYQFDVTKNGTEKTSFHKAYIELFDPKPLTIKGTAFEDLPKGNLKIKYNELTEPNNFEIIYIGQRKDGTEIYAVTSAMSINYDIMYFSSKKTEIKNRIYSNSITIGKSNPANRGGLPLYFTTYYCDKIVKIETGQIPNKSKVDESSNKELLWNKFWSTFKTAILNKNKNEVIRLSLEGDDFFDGGGGMTAKEWIDFADKETWNFWGNSINSGFKNFESDKKITKNNNLIFIFKDNNWFWYGVMGD